MNGEERSREIRILVLRILNDCRDYLLPEPRMLDHLQTEVMPPPTRAECEQEIRWLDNEALISGVRPDLGGARKWRITDKGRLALADTQ